MHIVMRILLAMSMVPLIDEMARWLAKVRERVAKKAAQPARGAIPPPQYDCRNPKARAAVMELLQHYGIDAEPCCRSADEAEELQDDRVGPEITCPDPELGSKLGRPKTGWSIIVSTPIPHALYAAEFLRSKGWEASVHPVELVGAPSDAFVFVQSNAFVGWVLAFRDDRVHL